jgi:predicted membrane channel-forming protein YqfA (hemolysin III family)
VTGFSDNDLESAGGWAIGAAILIWIAGRLGLPASVRIFVYVIVGFVALMAAAHLIDAIWLRVKRRRGASNGE